jgi:hypothetical protein
MHLTNLTNFKLKPSTLLFIILFFAIVSSITIVQNKKLEGFDSGGSSSFPGVLGKYPASENGGILDGGIYPAKGEIIIGQNQEQNLWKYYPVYEVGSYEQKTNNVRYAKNPDIGKCTPAEFCGTFYKSADLVPPNMSIPLDPTPPSEGPDNARVNYYWTPDNFQYFTTNPEMPVVP